MLSRFSLLSNVFSAFIIYFTVSIKIGDYIGLHHGEKKELKGEIIEMNLFHIIIKDSKGTIISIPNNKVLDEPLARLEPPTVKEVAKNHLLV